MINRLVVAVVLIAIGVLVARSLPDMKRYWKISRM